MEQAIPAKSARKSKKSASRLMGKIFCSNSVAIARSIVRRNPTMTALCVFKRFITIKCLIKRIPKPKKRVK